MCNESDLFRYEMATYGVGYLEDSESLIAGVSFVHNPDLSDRIRGQQCGSELLALLYSPCSDTLIGVQYNWIPSLISQYGNGHIPKSCPLHYFGNLAYMHLQEQLASIENIDTDAASTAVVMHLRARELVGEIELPNEIRDRLIADYDFSHKLLN